MSNPNEYPRHGPYPQTERKTVIENFHGTEIKDHYLWLESTDKAEVQEWIASQNQYSQDYLQQLPSRKQLEEEFMKLYAVGAVFAAATRGELLFSAVKEPDANQPRLLVRKGLNGEDKVLVDPNEISKEGTTAPDWWVPSEDGSLVAYGLSEDGREIGNLHVVDVQTGNNLSEKIPFVRWSDIAWLKDNSGFYYARNPEPGTVPEGQEYYNRHVFFHNVGDDHKLDIKVFGEGRNPQALYNFKLTEDEKTLVVNSYEFTRSDVFLVDCENNYKVTDVIVGKEWITEATPYGDELYFRTNMDAPNYKITKAPLSDPQPANWVEAVSEGNDVIQGIRVTHDKLFVNVLHNVCAKMIQYSLEGEFKKDVGFPPFGTFRGIWCHDSSDLFLVYFTSFVEPGCVFAYNMGTEQMDTLVEASTPINADDYQVAQEFFKSKDGTSIPMFLISRKDTDWSKPIPVLARGYGGFNVAMSPGFMKGDFVLLDRGAAVAVINLRGGDEFGERWHEAGMLDKKQNVFDDFIAAAEWLISTGRTTREQLGAVGGSNGGLLMGAMMTQRPDLFAAILCAVPLLDMLRYHHFSIARFWIPEYGTAEDSKQFEFIRKYSPYQHVKADMEFPPIFLTTAESDSRVDPSHAMKMAALLQYVNKDRENPILLKVESKAGHGSGKGMRKQVESILDGHGFLMANMGMLFPDL